MDKLVLSNDDVITADAIDSGVASGIILCFKKDLVIGVITYDCELGQWKYVDSMDYASCNSEDYLQGLIEHLYNNKLIDKAILRS